MLGTCAPKQPALAEDLGEPRNHGRECERVWH
jgi:hypothetical protein